MPAFLSAGLGSATSAFPRTPEGVVMGGARRGTHSGSGTPEPSEDALSVSVSMASGATSFSSAADACLFAPASTEDAVHAVPSLLSLLLSGRTDEQVGASGRGWWGMERAACHYWRGGEGCAVKGACCSLEE